MTTNASSKKLTIFGANGRVGKIVVAEALARGYHVTAFVHSHHDFAADPQLSIVHGNIYSAEDVHRAVKGSDAVVSCLGSWGTPKKDILSAAMKNIIPAMQTENISRIISLTGADARAPDDVISTLHKLTHGILNIVAPKIIADAEKHIELLDKSGLDWTVVRSPAMIGGKKQSYKLSTYRPLPWSIVRRAAVANAIVDLIDTTDNSHNSHYIQNG